MKTIAVLLFRIGFVVICGFISWVTVRLAIADWKSAPGTAVSLAQAIAIQPDSADLVARAAILRSDSGDPSPQVDQDLLKALQLNPLNSDVLMTLGLRREFDGNNTEAGIYLARASEVDHAFKASWTYANFCYRTNQLDEFWRMTRRCLSLEPLGFSPDGVFDLAWRVMTESKRNDSKKILEVIPKDGPRPVQYLSYLMDTKRADAAIEAWPGTLNSLDPSVALDANVVTGFPDFLVDNDRISTAVRAWGQLVDRGIVQSGHLTPETGASIADPTFQHPAFDRQFGWTVTHEAGAFAASLPSMLQFELDGNEPQSLRLVSTLAPILSGRSYRLKWKDDPSRLVSPRDPGFQFVIVRRTGEVIAECEPLLAGGETGTCEFRSSGARDVHVGKESAYDAVRIELHYARALGTVRAKGVLRLIEVRLEFAS